MFANACYTRVLPWHLQHSDCTAVPVNTLPHAQGIPQSHRQLSLASNTRFLAMDVISIHVRYDTN